MYFVKIDDDIIKVANRNISATELIELVGEEPTDCVLVSLKDNIIFRKNIDLEKYRNFKTVHPDFIKNEENEKKTMP